MEQPWVLNTTSPCSLERFRTRLVQFNYSLLGFTLIIGTWANVLVCWLVGRAKRVRPGSKALLANLAAGDLTRCLVDSPVFLARLVLSERHVRSGSALCRVQQLTYLLCSCAQLLTLAAISVERFQTIAFPFNPEKRKGRIWLWILIIWIFSVTLAASSLIVSIEPLSFPMCRLLHSVKLSALHAGSLDAYFLIPIWALCVLLMAVNYLRIFAVVKQHSNKIFDSGVQPRLCMVTCTSGCRLPQSSPLETGRGEGSSPRPASEIVGAVCVLTPKAKALGKARVEGKLAKRLGYIIANVVLFWMPLVVLLTLRLVVKCGECCIVQFNYSLLGFTLIIGTWANVLVCWLVGRAKRVRPGSKALLANLAAGDLTRCLVDSPVFLARLVLSERHVRSGSALCRVQQLTYLLCSCAQLLTLAAISVERFQTIAFPFNPEKRKGRIWLWILIIWIFSVTLAASSLIVSIEPLSFPMCRLLHSVKLSALHAGSLDAYFLIPIWALCVLLMAVNYLRIFAVVKQHSNKIFDSGVQPRLCMVTCTSGCRLPQSSPLETGRGEGSSPRPASEIVGAVCVLTPKAKALGKARVEGKLAKRLGYIIANVVLFWMPLVVLLTLRLVVKCGECCSWVMWELEASAMVLTCVPAAVDPLIYTLLHRHIYTEFRKLFCTNQSCS